MPNGCVQLGGDPEANPEYVEGITYQALEHRGNPEGGAEGSI